MYNKGISICVLIIIIRKCYGVGVEYFEVSESKLSDADEEDFEKSKSETTTIILRTPYIRSDGITCTLEDEKNTKANVSEKIDYQNTSTKEYRRMETTETSSTTPYHFSNEFFHYDEDGDTFLRSNIDFDDLLVVPYNPDESKQTNRPGKKGSTRSKLYTLEPAIATFNLSIQNITHSPPDVSTWFSIDRAPCWDLPLLYGRLAGKNRDTFSIYRSLVEYESVIYAETPIVHKSHSLPLPDPGTHARNKWCEMTPCYADHILCSRRGTQVSTICGSGFYAEAPTVTQQAAITNRINSLRNFIASGTEDVYPYLPPAANMKQMVYDKDLERMSLAWVRQCMPGPAPCASLDEELVTQLECSKYHNKCCLDLDAVTAEYTCTAQPECMVDPVIGCLHTWFSSAGPFINSTDVRCGHIEKETFNLAQLIWAETDKIGCAYGRKPSGDVRVICSFAPGARYFLKTDYFCGLLELYKTVIPDVPDVTDLKFLETSDIFMRPIDINTQYKSRIHRNKTSRYSNHSFQDHVQLTNRKEWGVKSLSKTYKQGWARKLNNVYTNGTYGVLARVVTRYKFEEETGSRCDVDDPIYVIGEKASLCTETGRQFSALCYEYRDPTPEYRMVAIMAAVSLFTLILFDLFRCSVRQATY